jgi:hypothetical protein
MPRRPNSFRMKGSQRLLHWATALLWLGYVLGFAKSEAQSIPPGGSAPSSVSGPDSRNVKITINPSTSHIIVGAVYGLDAEIQNTSNVAVTIDLKKMFLSVQPELAPPNIACTWFYSPAQGDDQPPMIMRPGDHFTVFFDTGARAADRSVSPQCKATFWGGVRRRLNFIPGNYAFILTGSYLLPKSVPTLPAGSVTLPINSSRSAPESEEHYFTETASLPVAIDQTQIILYAGLGGLLAFLVMTFRQAAQTSNRASVQGFFVSLPKAAAAILVSVTVTVIASRLSTTSFPVKVSVEDFWGALTVGFVSYFIGGKFIDKLSDTLAPVTPALAPAPVPAPTPGPP